MFDFLSNRPKGITVHWKSVRFLFLAMLPLLVFGCAYPISKQLREEARNEPTFPMILKNPQAYIGSVVIWGGSIVETQAKRDGTDIIALETPLNLEERPERAEYSEGRFIARSSKFLDPAIYGSGRRITVAGEIIGQEIRPLDESKYSYPVIRIKQIHIWRRQWVSAYPPDAYWWGWDWDTSGYEPWDPFWPYDAYPYNW